MQFYTVTVIMNEKGERLQTCKIIKDHTRLGLQTCAFLYANMPFMLYSGRCRNTARELTRRLRNAGCVVESKIL